MRCQKCEKSNKWDTVFCRFCGARVGQGRVRLRDALNKGELLLTFVSNGAFFLAIFLHSWGDSIHVSGGGTNQPAYVFYNASLSLMFISLPFIFVTTFLLYDRMRKATALRQAADAAQKQTASIDSEPPTPTEPRRQLDQLILKRATRELGAYKRMWWGTIIGAAAILVLLIPIQITGHLSGLWDPSFFASALLFAYVYFFVVSVVFIGYPSSRKVREITSGWRTDPTALVPLYTEGRVTPPNSFMMPMCGGLTAIWVTQFFVLFLLIFSPASSNLDFFLYLLGALGFGGMVMHRLHATRTVESALEDRSGTRKMQN